LDVYFRADADEIVVGDPVDNLGGREGLFFNIAGHLGAFAGTSGFWKGTISFVRPHVPRDPARRAVLASATGGGWGDDDVLKPEAL
jgi:hypothetical protein